jgi:hypothetical protein
MDGSATPKPTRVLRAADVIPPFDDDASPVNPIDLNGVPTFDLAESILAEQRRIATAKRKRGPRSARREMTPAEVGAALTPAEPPEANEDVRPTLIQPFDLTALHQIVAGIVSRDIERLCTGPSVAL